MTIVPDDKDWTWVLAEACPECGVDVSAIERGQVAVLTRRLGEAWSLILADGPVAGDRWARRGRRGDGARFTVESFARYFVHDPLHHLWDVGRPLPL